ncbi:MAG: hypothetical protein JWO40_174 [Candidatus Doudnabacteria bacterium]|nr:hypothetical protein [Candidatus Doudnabacteria bacterium]
MTASLNALRSAKDKTVVILTLLSLVPWITPVAKAHAQIVGQENSQVFEIKTENPDSLLSPENKISQIKKENADKQVALLTEYLEKRNSPLADYAGIILAQKDWKTIIAISNAESTMGQHCYYNNCSGIYARYDQGYAGLKKYETKADWIVDLQGLLSKRYDGWTLDKMNGIYVYPRSTSWIRATKSVYTDLNKIEQQFPQES